MTSTPAATAAAARQPGAPTAPWGAATAAERTAGQPASTTDRAGQLCIVVTDLADGGSGPLLRGLRRSGQARVMLLARRASRPELLALLDAGIRGALATQTAAVLSPVAEPRPGARLTDRELAVLGLVADGRSNREIGRLLGLSSLTIKSHLARISRKLGTGDRAGLVARAIRAGALD